MFTIRITLNTPSRSAFCREILRDHHDRETEARSFDAAGFGRTRNRYRRTRPDARTAVGRAIRLVATIEAVNHAERTVVIKGPDGAEETVKVSHHDSLKHLKVGDQIVITLTNVVAVELKPENPA